MRYFMFWLLCLSSCNGVTQSIRQSGFPRPIRFSYWFLKWIYSCRYIGLTRRRTPSLILFYLNWLIPWDGKRRPEDSGWYKRRWVACQAVLPHRLLSFNSLDSDINYNPSSCWDNKSEGGQESLACRGSRQHTHKRTNLAGSYTSLDRPERIQLSPRTQWRVVSIASVEERGHFTVKGVNHWYPLHQALPFFWPIA